MRHSSEAAWNELYNGVVEWLGPERAETLMAHLLKDELTDMRSDIGVLKSDVGILKSDVAVLKSDVAVLKSDVAVLKSDVGILKSDVAELKTDVKAINRNLITGLIVILASMVGVLFAAI